MNNISIFMPAGSMGRNELDSSLDTVLRDIAERVGDTDDWCDKYGANFENNVFAMHKFCWCEKDDCEWCRTENPRPNFEHKPSGFKVWWYKYIGRSTETNKDISDSELQGIYTECLASVEKAPQE